MLKEINDSWYTIQGSDGVVFETTDKAAARLALREGRDVTKNTRCIFSSGKSDIRLYVSTDVMQAKEL